MKGFVFKYIDYIQILNKIFKYLSEMWNQIQVTILI